jgi:hypothetical protein
MELIIETLALSIMSPTVFTKFFIWAFFYPVNPDQDTQDAQDAHDAISFILPIL